ncbi:MAG: hypothetical protein M1489_02645, partial [Firmicutes bacterium]|nr:hypothetical protein [Bacillota bacterium]
MAVRKLCVQEITTLNRTETFTVTCTTPAYTPTGLGNPSEANAVLYNVAFTVNPVPTVSFSYDVQFKYAYSQNGGTFEEFCDVLGNSSAITFNTGVTTCDCQDAFSITSSIATDSAAITTTQSPNSVS